MPGRGGEEKIKKIKKKSKQECNTAWGELSEGGTPPKRGPPAPYSCPGSPTFISVPPWQRWRRAGKG